MRLAVEAGRLAYLAGRIPRKIVRVGQQSLARCNRPLIKPPIND